MYLYSVSRLFPVSGVVVRSGDTSHLETFVSVGSPAVCIEIDAELVVKTFEEVQEGK